MPEVNNNLPVEIGFWLAALTPILILLILLVWRRWSTSAAAPVALAASVIAAIFLFNTPLETLAVAAGKGIWDAIFVLYVIVPALILYHVTEGASAFESIQSGIRKFIPDRLLVVLTFAWVLSSFIQGVAGFGTPLAVTAPLMLGLGVKPIYAVLLPLIGRAWGNMFGSLGTTWLATTTVVDISAPQTTLVYSAILLWIPNLTAGLTIAWFYGGWWGIKRGAPAIGAITLLHGGLQLALVPFLPVIGNFLAASAALGGIVLLSRWSFYRRQDENEPDAIFTEQAIKKGKSGGQKDKEKSEAEKTQVEFGEDRKASRPEAEKEDEQHKNQTGETGKMPLWLAFAPYIVLGTVAIIALLIPPVNGFLESYKIGLPFPATTTGYGVTREAAESYAAFAPFTHPGTILLVAAVFGYVLYTIKNRYPKNVSLGGMLKSAGEDSLPSITAIVALLLISKTMDHSGEITVLALGITAVSPQIVFIAASNFIGILGSFITSSNTASNILFAPLQATAAEVEQIPTSLTIAAQSAGGATGNAIAPSDVLLGATVARIPDRLGAILAKALPWTLATGALVSAASIAIFYIWG